MKRREVKKLVLIDTQLLVLLIVGLTNHEYISRHRRLAPVYDQTHLAALKSILAGAPKLVCTAHVLTEASNLLRQIADPMRSEIISRSNLRSLLSPCAPRLAVA